MRGKKGRYFGMCAGDEFTLQVELGGSLTLNKETMYTEKANSVNSCTFGQVHENMVKCSSKRDSQQWPLVQILTKEEISALRSVGQEGKKENCTLWDNKKDSIRRKRSSHYRLLKIRAKHKKKKKRMQLFYCRYWGTRPAEWWIVLQGTEELDLQKIFAQWILCRKWKSGRITGKWGFNPWAIISWFVYAGNWRLRQGVEDSTLDPNLHVYLWGR